jgi:hypothetical protein
MPEKIDFTSRIGIVLTKSMESLNGEELIEIGALLFCTHLKMLNSD